MKKAKVIKSTGSWYTIENDQGQQYNARIVGKFRLNDIPLTNPVAVGDEVYYELEDLGETNAIIKDILPRKNYIVRQSPRKKHQLHLLASNIDLALLVVTMVQPKLKPGVIDRFLLMTEPHDVPAAIVFNKADLYEEDDLDFFEYCQAVYESIGYKVFLASCLTGEGIDGLREFLIGKTVLFAGQSGVGKSTLLNTLDPNLDLRTSELSDYSGKGQHTTTFAEMHPFRDGYIIDTPGFKTLSFNNLEPMDVAHNFREFFILSEDCYFPDCTHRNEPKCSVKSSLEKGEISEMRYQNYLRILEEIEEQNYWERHKDL
ncbi:MAG: ribosome small subunit-dependent GTPase A [Saprospiraceae bacterium]|nr:ribosome small subunit-dependent GTPase A [Saprospiraceae bacterium]